MRKTPRNLPYDHEWHQLSVRFLKAHPICMVRGCGRRSRHVDHIVTVRVRLCDSIAKQQGICMLTLSAKVAKFASDG